MSSLYAQYIEERGGSLIIEKEWGFVTYEIQNETIFIVDLFVAKDFRIQGKARELGEEVMQIGREKGCKTLLGGWDPRALNSLDSLKAFIASGLKPLRIENGLVFFVRDL